MSDDVKTLLKEARESFKQNEHLETMKKCKKILKKDKNNYTALILLARAMQEVEEFKSQVALVLQKAVEVQPSSPLAWQGLVAYYEKISQDNGKFEKLATAYCKLLQLDSDSPKFASFVSKVSEIGLRTKDDEVLSEILDTLSALRDTSTKEKRSLIEKTLAWMLTEYSNRTNKYQELYESVLASVVNDTDLMNRQEYYRKYLKILRDTNKLTILLATAQDMHTQFPEDAYPLEFVCQVYYEEEILNGHELEEVDITHYYESLLKFNVNSETAFVARAVHLRCTDKLVNSRECLTHVVSALNAQSFYAWLMLSQVYCKLYCWEETENASRQTLQLLKPHLKGKLQRDIKLRLLEAMSRSSNKQKLIEARQMCEELLKIEPSVQVQLIRARTNVLLDEPDVAALDDLESRDETKIQAVIFKALHLWKRKRYEEAVNALELALESSEAWLLFGKIYWDMNDYNHSLMAFLNGVQADRNNWECMLYLGHYYREHGNDIERSRKCYHAALQINPNSEEAGIGLSTAYRLLKNTDANIQLLQRMTMQGNGPKWAWLQLGLHHLDQGDAGQAITALQHVIRADPNDNHSWESLADAYLARGAYTSALKSYQRALELSPESLYPLIQLAHIKVLIGQHKEAKEDFESILQHDERHIFALKGLSQACLGLARENIAKQFLCRARENLQQAADSLTDAVTIRGDLSCNWKLFGDVCYTVATLPEKYCYLRVKRVLVKYDNIDEHIKIKGKEIIALSTRCFCRALSITPNAALLWHDLACCYLMQLNRDSAIDKTDVAAKCLAAAKHAIKLHPQSWLHWNVLGVVCMSPHVKNYALAQHCFVMAIDRELNNAVAWNNLGTLYLHLGDLYKANEAFSRAQRADPSYMNSWIGQGFIAESLVRPLRKEAMDLFRHSTQLGYHNQAALGYAHWVLTTLLDPAKEKDPLFVYAIENMHAVPAATDVMTWYTEREPNDVHALNIYGLLLERQKLYNTAAKQFVTALELTQDEDERDILSVNLARVLIQVGEHQKAVELCRQVKCVTFVSQYHLALSLFKAKQYEESYNSYEAALHWLADTEEHRANVLCAMAAIAHIFQGADAVKTLLFQCIQIEPPTIVGFLATAALGILHDDFNLASLVLKELKRYEDHPEYGHHVITLSAYYHVKRGKLTEAIRILSKAIFRHPNDIRYWVRLVRISLLDTNLETFRKCAQAALVLSRNTSMTDIVYVACASAYGNFGTADGLRQAQKNIFTYPANVESWINYSAALISRCEDKNFKIDSRWISSLISIIRSQFRTSENTSQWLLDIAQKITFS